MYRLARFFCISIYCVYVVSLHIDSTESMITLLVGEKLCRVNNVTFDYFGMAYKDSDYTAVIAMMQ